MHTLLHKFRPKEEQEILRFKELKRPAKRKQDQAPTDWLNENKKKRKLAETPNDRAEQKHRQDQGDPPEGWKEEPTSAKKNTAEPGQDEVETQAGQDTDGGEASQESTSVTEMEEETKTSPEGWKTEAADRVA